MEIRELDKIEIARIGEIDRSEEIQQYYIWREGMLHLVDQNVSSPPWTPDGKGEHSVPALIREWAPLLEAGGTLIGALDHDALVAFAIYCPDLAPDVAQLAVLHVSQPYRRQGLGKKLSLKCIELARKDGAVQIYVSSTPTRGTVDFYLTLGFKPADQVIQALYDLEPDDIHMTRDVA